MGLKEEVLCDYVVHNFALPIKSFNGTKSSDTFIDLEVKPLTEHMQKSVGADCIYTSP